MYTPRLPVVDWTDAPRRFKWSRPFRRKTKSGFVPCAITFQMQSPSICIRHFQHKLTACFTSLGYHFYGTTAIDSMNSCSQERFFFPCWIFRFFTYQPCFQLSGHINSQNSRSWSAENPHELHGNHLQSLKLVFSALRLENGLCNRCFLTFDPLNAELSLICHLLALLGAHHILHVSRIKVKNHASYI
jgi:hypothetical protein